MMLSEKADLCGLILDALRDKPLSLADLKAVLGLHEVPITIGLRDLQEQGAIEHGYLMPDGEWLIDYFPDESAISCVWRAVK